MAAATEVENANPSDAVSSWITGLGDLGDTPASKPPTEEKPDVGKKPDVPTGESPGDSAALAGGRAGPAGGKTPEGGAVAAEKAPDKTQQTETTPPKPTAAAEDEKWPRDSKAWEKFKQSRREAEDKLRGEITQRETAINELKAQLAAAEEKASKHKELSPEEKTEMDYIKKENEEMSRRLQVLEVTQHPRFQSYFKNKIDAQVALAKRIVGEEHAKAIEEALALPDTAEFKEIKENRIQEIVNDLSGLQQSRIGGVLNNLVAIAEEKEEEIAKAKELREQSQAADSAEREEAKRKVTEATEAALKDGIKRLQDEANGSPLFKYRQGDDKWNADVKNRIDLAKKLFYGSNDIGLQDYVQAAFAAVSFPTLLKSYQEQVKTSKAEIAKLNEQVKALTAAQPRRGETPEPSGGAPENKMNLNKEMNPMDVTAAWLKSGPWAEQ